MAHRAMSRSHLLRISASTAKKAAARKILVASSNAFACVDVMHPEFHRNLLNLLHCATGLYKLTQVDAEASAPGSVA
jgi:hypothetical protein